MSRRCRRSGRPQRRPGRPVVWATFARKIIMRSAVELPGEDGQPLPMRRLRPLSSDDIRALLRGGGVRFIFANPGAPLTWAQGPEVFKVWKTEVEPHLAAPDAEVLLEQFPGEYAYFASLWTASSRQEHARSFCSR
jgi:hypothetical protein